MRHNQVKNEIFREFRVHSCSGGSPVGHVWCRPELTNSLLGHHLLGSSFILAEMPPSPKKYSKTNEKHL